MPGSITIARKAWPDAKKVVDAREGCIVTVDENDLKRAAKGRKTHTNCAFAMACKEHLKREALVSTRTVFLYNPETKIVTRYGTSTRIAEGLRNYDHGINPATGQYNLLKPAPRLPRGSGTRHAGDPSAGKLKHRRTTLARPMRAENIRPSLNTAVVTK